MQVGQATFLHQLPSLVRPTDFNETETLVQQVKDVALQVSLQKEGRTFEENLSILKREKIIDDKGLILPSSALASQNMFPLDTDELLEVVELLTTPIDIEGLEIKTSPMEILHHYFCEGQEFSKTPVEEVMLGGGAAKKVLKRHFFKSWEAAGLSQELLKEMLTVVSFNEGPINMCMMAPTETEENKLISFKRNLIHWFNRKRAKGYSKEKYETTTSLAKNNFILQFSDVCRSVGIFLKRDSPPVNLIYSIFGQEPRTFCCDSFQIPLRAIVSKYHALNCVASDLKKVISEGALKDEVFPVCDLDSQAFVDNLTGIVRAADPKQISNEAWANLMADCIKGKYFLSDHSEEDASLEASALEKIYQIITIFHNNGITETVGLSKTLKEKGLDPKADPFDGVPFVIVAHLKRVLEEQFCNDPSAAIALTYRACQSLAQFEKRGFVSQYINTIWEEMSPCFKEATHETTGQTAVGQTFLSLEVIERVKRHAEHLLEQEDPSTQLCGLEILLKACSFQNDTQSFDLILSRLPNVYAQMKDVDRKNQLLKEVNSLLRDEQKAAVLAKWVAALPGVSSSSPNECQFAWIKALASVSEGTAFEAVQLWEKFSSSLDLPAKGRGLEELIPEIACVRPDLALQWLGQLVTLGISWEKERSLFEVINASYKVSLDPGKKYLSAIEDYARKIFPKVEFGEFDQIFRNLSEEAKNDLLEQHFNRLIGEKKFQLIIDELEEPAAKHLRKENREEIIRAIWNMFNEIKDKNHTAALPCLLFVMRYLKGYTLPKESEFRAAITSSQNWALEALKEAKKAEEIKTLLKFIQRHDVDYGLDEKAFESCLWAFDELQQRHDGSLQYLRDMHEFLDLSCHRRTIPSKPVVTPCVQSAETEQGCSKGSSPEQSPTVRKGKKRRKRKSKKATSPTAATKLAVLPHEIELADLDIRQRYTEIMQCYVELSKLKDVEKWLSNGFSKQLLPIKGQDDNLCALLISFSALLRTKEKFKKSLAYFNRVDTSSLNAENRAAFAKELFALIIDDKWKAPLKQVSQLIKHAEILEAEIDSEELTALKTKLIESLFEMPDLSSTNLQSALSLMKRTATCSPSMWRTIYRIARNHENIELSNDLWHTLQDFLEPNEAFRNSPERIRCWIGALQGIRNCRSPLGIAVLKEFDQLKTVFQSNPTLFPKAVKVALESFVYHFREPTQERETLEFLDKVEDQITELCRDPASFSSRDQRGRFIIYFDILFAGLSAVNGDRETLKSACEIMEHGLESVGKDQLKSNRWVSQINTTLARISRAANSLQEIDEAFSNQAKSLILATLQLNPVCQKINFIPLLTLFYALPNEYLKENYWWRDIKNMLTAEFTVAQQHKEVLSVLSLVLRNIIAKAIEMNSIPSLKFASSCFENKEFRTVADLQVSKHWPVFFDRMYCAIERLEMSLPESSEKEEKSVDSSAGSSSQASLGEFAEDYSNLFKRITDNLKDVFEDAESRNRAMAAAQKILLKFFHADDNERFQRHFEDILIEYKTLMLQVVTKGKEAVMENSEVDFAANNFKMQFLQEALSSCSKLKKLPNECFVSVLQILYRMQPETKNLSTYQKLLETLTFDIDAIYSNQKHVTNFGNLLKSALINGIFDDHLERKFHIACLFDFLIEESWVEVPDEERQMYFKNLVDRLLKKDCLESYATISRLMSNFMLFFKDVDSAAICYRSYIDTIFETIRQHSEKISLIRFFTEHLFDDRRGNCMRLKSKPGTWPYAAAFSIWKILQALCDEEDCTISDAKFQIAYAFLQRSLTHHCFEGHYDEYVRCLKLVIPLAFQYRGLENCDAKEPDHFEEMVSKIGSLLWLNPGSSPLNELDLKKRALCMNEFISQLISNKAIDQAVKMFAWAKKMNIYKNLPEEEKKAAEMLKISES